VVGDVADRQERCFTRFRRPISIWSSITVLLLVGQTMASRWPDESSWRPWPWRGIDWYLGAWSQFDGPEYLRIVTDGYRYTPGERSNIVWFPLYPNVVRLVDAALGTPLLSGVLVSLAAGLASAIAVWAWLGVTGITDLRTRTFAFLSVFLYPYAWYLFGPVHSDSLFLALTVAAFLLVERRALVAAGVVGAFAVATRPTGMALILALFVLGLERTQVLTFDPGADGPLARWRIPTRFDRSAWRPGNLGPLLSFGGLLAWMTYLGVQWGDPLAFKTNQTVYHPSPLPLLKLPFLVRWRDFDDPSYVLTTTLQAALALVVVCCVPAVIRRFGLGYGIFCALLVAIPTVSTADFMGTGRYLIAAFCVWALIGEWLSTRRLGWLPIAGSGLLMATLAMLFARSWYLT